MTDIVKKLRNSCSCNFPDTPCGAEDECRAAFDAADEIERLRSALPEGMEHCKIIFEECEAGHGRLRGDNWLKKECPWCKIKEQADEIERLRAEMNARDPVDAMDRGMSPVEAAVYHVWGERCSDFEPGCTTCKAWAEFDQIKRLVKSRNRWGQKYNKLLSAVRTENAYGVYTEARDEYRRVITEQASEIERLRNDVRLAVMSDSKECTAISEVNARLRAEVERLRAALEVFACDCEGKAICLGNCMHRNARAALEGKHD
jgi:hypothetical protein